MAEPCPSDFALALRQNARDMLGAFLPRYPEAALPLVRGPARDITRLVFQYERMVGETDLVQASQWLLPAFTRSVQAVNLPEPAIAPGQPLLVLGNHAGVMDAMALFALTGRPDLKVITAERPILALLPNIAQHLILLPEAGERRIRVLRTALAHLRGGGALLNFPAGRIEPDPAWYDNAPESLAAWSAEGIELFARQVPQLTVLPAAVSGVISARALRSAPARIYREGRRRSWVAATLQVMFSRWRDSEVTLRFGDPLVAGPGVATQVLATMDNLLRISLREGTGRAGVW
ncbi:MAG: hypothetical protein OXB89_09900 [Anaerolineaceae bacterium]|nr:hypothetical protein [Anaerolineaceae bacterium]